MSRNSPFSFLGTKPTDVKGPAIHRLALSFVSFFCTVATLSVMDLIFTAMLKWN